MAEALLELKNVSAAYGRIKALKEVSFHVESKEIVCMIGANGAGKSTTLMTICQVVKPTGGEVYYRGEMINGWSFDRLPPKGLCQVPEGRRIFPRLTIDENLDMGAFFRRDREGVAADKKTVFDFFPILKERRRQPGGTLSGGEQQMLAIARALMGRPKMLLLDEPSLGLAPLLVKQIFNIIQSINEQEEVTILLVEQNANVALQISKRGYVMETGKVVMRDSAAALLNNPEIRKAYLGE